MDFFNFDRTPTYPGACTVLGIYSQVSGWNVGTAEDTSSGVRTYNQPYIQKCDNVAHDARSFWVGNSATPDSYANNAGDPEATDGAAGVFALTTGGGPRSAAAENVLRSSNVYRFDRNAPNITAPTMAWTNDPVVTVSDQGLGGKSVSIWNGNDIGGAFAGSTVDPCTGGHGSAAGGVPCPIHSQLHPQLPEGERTFTAYGYDAVGWWSNPVTFQTKVDRTPPQVELTGSLSEQVNQILGEGTFDLHVAATDFATPAS